MSERASVLISSSISQPLLSSNCYLGFSVCAKVSLFLIKAARVVFCDLHFEYYTVLTKK